MKKSRFTEEQIFRILQGAESGAKPEDVWRRHGISRDAFYRWRKHYAGIEASDVRKLKQLEEGNRRLKRLVADQALNIQVLKEVVGNES